MLTMGFSWEKIQASTQDDRGLDHVFSWANEAARCKRTSRNATAAASTTGFRDGLPLVTGAQIGDGSTGLHLALGIVTALYQRTSPARASGTAAMQDGVLISGTRETARSAAARPRSTEEYSQFGKGSVRDVVPAPAMIPAAVNPAAS